MNRRTIYRATLVGFLSFLTPIGLTSSALAQETDSEQTNYNTTPYNIPEQTTPRERSSLEGTAAKESEDDEDPWYMDIQIEFALGYGYLFDPEGIAQLQEDGYYYHTTPKHQHVSFLKKVNYSLDLVAYFPLFRYWSLGVGIHNRYITSFIVGITNRIQVPLTDPKIAFFLDIMGGYSLSQIKDERLAGILSARVGAIYRITEDLALSASIGGDQDYEIISSIRQLSSLRLHFGVSYVF